MVSKENAQEVVFCTYVKRNVDKQGNPENGVVIDQVSLTEN